MIIEGRVHKFGDNVNTDEIIPARFLVTVDAAQLGKNCMDGILPGFSGRIDKGDIIVAGKNFGCGSSREHAPLAIKGAGISCVIASSFARIFYRNAVNIGLPILECAQVKSIVCGDRLSIDLSQGVINNLTRNQQYYVQRYPEFMQEIINSGGLMAWITAN